MLGADSGRGAKHSLGRQSRRLWSTDNKGADLKGRAVSNPTHLPLLLSQKLDETVLSRFWSSLNQPLKPAVQCWTTIPAVPDDSQADYSCSRGEVRFSIWTSSTGSASDGAGWQQQSPGRFR